MKTENSCNVRVVGSLVNSVNSKMH